VGSITTNDRGQTDAALVRRFRQAVTKRFRVTVFDRVVRRHRDAVLSRCAERLWPDADAAVAAAHAVLVVAYLSMADPAKLARPERLRDWLTGIAARSQFAPGLPAGSYAIDWEALQAGIAADAPGKPDMRSSAARRAWLRRWLEQIVATLPEPRQQMYDLFVRRALDSRNAARKLGTDADVVRRLRGENREAILRAFEVTALVAAEAAQDWRGRQTPGCGQLRRILADAQRDGGLPEGVRRDGVVLPADLRLTVTSHVGQCGTCRQRRDECMAQWAPELLPILAGAELNEQVIADVRTVLEPRPDALAPDGGRARGRVARRSTGPVGPGKAVIARRAGLAGAGLLVVLLLLGFVQPGFLLSTAASGSSSSSSSSPKDPSSGSLDSSGNPQMAGTSAEVSGRPVPSATRGTHRSTRGPAASSSAATRPSPSTAQPSSSPTSASAKPSASPRASSSSPSPSPASSSPVPSTPTPTHSATPTPTPTTPASPTPTPTSTPTPTPTASDLTTAPPSSSTPSTSPAS
jgi:hypothetical protein